MPGFPVGGIGTHYGDTSLVEDVTDIIYQITPEDTPFFTMAGDTRALQPVHIYQTRNLTTRAQNSQPEGFTYDFTAVMTLPTRTSNLTQILAKEIRVSETEIASAHYAISNLFADQMQIRLVELKTDMEHALIQGTLVSGSATDTDRTMQGIINAIVSNVTTYTNTTFVSMSEDNFNDFFQTSWDEGGEPRDVLVGGYMKRKISAFTAGGTKFIPQDEQRVVNTISIYESDFFPVQVHLSRDIPRQGSPSGYSGYAVLFVDRTMIRKAWLRRVTSRRVPETADSADGVIKTELTLEHGHDSAHHYAEHIL